MPFFPQNTFDLQLIESSGAEPRYRRLTVSSNFPNENTLLRK